MSSKQAKELYNIFLDYTDASFNPAYAKWNYLDAEGKDELARLAMTEFYDEYKEEIDDNIDELLGYIMEDNFQSEYKQLKNIVKSSKKESKKVLENKNLNYGDIIKYKGYLIQVDDNNDDNPEESVCTVYASQDGLDNGVYVTTISATDEDNIKEIIDTDVLSYSMSGEEAKKLLLDSIVEGDDYSTDEEYEQLVNYIEEQCNDVAIIESEVDVQLLKPMGGNEYWGYPFGKVVTTLKDGRVFETNEEGAGLNDAVELTVATEIKDDTKHEKKTEDVDIAEHSNESKKDFSGVEFEKEIPHTMRFKEYSFITDEDDDNCLYWVTQQFFNENEVKQFADAFSKMNIAKAYVTVRDLSWYDYAKDKDEGALVKVNRDGSYDMTDYLNKCEVLGYNLDESKQIKTESPDNDSYGIVVYTKVNNNYEPDVCVKSITDDGIYTVATSKDDVATYTKESVTQIIDELSKCHPTTLGKHIFVAVKISDINKMDSLFFNNKQIKTKSPDVQERIKSLKLMDQAARCVNDDDVFELWLMAGVPDGASEEDYEDIAQDDKMYKEVEDEFKRIIKLAKENGALYDCPEEALELVKKYEPNIENYVDGHKVEVLKNESLKDYGVKPSDDFYQRIMNALTKELDISQYDVQKEADAIKFRYNEKVYFAEPASMYQIDVFDDNHNQIGWGVSMNDLKAEVFTEYKREDFIYHLVGGNYAGVYTRAEAEKLPIKANETTADNPGRREELKNQLIFNGYLGPMYDGIGKDDKPVIRYETQEVYDQLSEAKFKDKVKAIKKSLKDKDGRLSDKTAEEQAKKIAGSMIKDEESKKIKTEVKKGQQIEVVYNNKDGEENTTYFVCDKDYDIGGEQIRVAIQSTDDDIDEIVKLIENNNLKVEEYSEDYKEGMRAGNAFAQRIKTVHRNALLKKLNDTLMLDSSSTYSDDYRNGFNDAIYELAAKVKNAKSMYECFPDLKK